MIRVIRVIRIIRVNGIISYRSYIPSLQRETDRERERERVTLMIAKGSSLSSKPCGPARENCMAHSIILALMFTSTPVKVIGVIISVKYKGY